jgi:hypothetical protein
LIRVKQGLSDFCLFCTQTELLPQLAEAAQQNGMACLYAGIEGWRNLSYTERTDIESV